MLFKKLFGYLLLLSWLPVAVAMDSQAVINSAERVQFAKGQFSAVMTGQIDSQVIEKHYILRANAGQTMAIQLNSNTPYAFISVFQVAGNQLQEILSSSATSTHWSNGLTRNADYVIRVALTQPDTIQIHYRLEVSIYSGQPKTVNVTPPPPIVPAPTTSTPAIKTVEEAVQEAAEQAIPTIPAVSVPDVPVKTVINQPAEATNNVGMLVTSSEIEGDYILDRKVNLNVLKIFGNRVFIRITGLGQTTCNFTGSGLLTSDVVSIHNKFINETIQFEFLPDRVLVRGSGKANTFCAGSMSIVGKYVRPHLLPPVRVAEPTVPTRPSTSNTAQPKNVIDMLKCRCSVFNRESATIQQIMQVWMHGFRQGKKGSTQLTLDLSATNMEASLAQLTQHCATNTNLYLLQVHDDLAEHAQQQASNNVEEEEGALAFMRKLVKKVGNIIESISSNELDMSRHLCFDFRQQGEENQRIIMSWLLGYGQGRMHNFSEIPVDFSVSFLDQNIQILDKYCASHENEVLVSAADSLSSK
ncbi:hypothetical protein [Candidatus Albibeggiatoa sp. nov. NOAA]|uniref:hypothetical protein n=1 Tax=Candidatus Albibeggiatoa sp. nov. NOAA TaxID=3162724 RepID=UPI0032F4B1CF|nr:hypothetical protein [Thiotrichaceae bacterium]